MTTVTKYLTMDMELSESLSTRELELRSASDHLKSCSSSEMVQHEIEINVEESVVQWNDSRKSLRNLCERYQNALKIWTVYRKNSDIVNEWVDNQLNSLSTLPTEEAVQQLQIYEEAVNKQLEKLVELHGMVMEIATEVDVKKDNLLVDEIALLSRKLEDIRSAISTLQDVTVFEIKQTEILNNLDASSDRQKISVVNLLESWQQVFKETFLQYHRLFSSVSGEQNYLEALKLWTDYLLYIQDFLASAIPDNYHTLDNDHQICQLYENLLLSQSAILLDEKTKRIGSSLGGEIECLNKLHNETLSNVIARHHQVKQRLLLWQRYQKDQRELLSFLRCIESEQSHLNLRFICIRKIDASLHEIEDLLNKITKGISMADNLRDQHDALMSGCSQSVITSVKVELDSSYKRLHNSEAALKTWHEYLFKIKSVAKLYDDIASNIEQIFIKICKGIDNEVCTSKQTTYAVVEIKQKIDNLMKLKEEIVALDEATNELTNLEEILKHSVNPKDMKVVRQRIWLLKQQQNDIKYQLSTLIFQLEEKSALWDAFDKRQQSFMSWANDLNTNLKKFCENQDYLEVVLRQLESEFCTDVDSKHDEYNWLLSTGKCLSKYESESATEPICGRINNVMDAWKKVNDNTKREVEKIKHIVKELTTSRSNIKNLIVWIPKLSLKLNTILFFQRFDESALNEKIQEHEALQKEIDQRKQEVSDVLQRCKIFVMDCEHCKVSMDIKSVIVRYTSLDRKWTWLQMESAQCKDRIFVVWKMIQEVLSLCQSEDPWLTEQRELLTKIRSQCDKVPFSDINSLVAELNSISVAINNHSTQFKLLEESYADLLSKNHIPNSSLVQETLDRYSALKKFVSRLNGKIDEDSLKWNEFLSSHGNLILKLGQLDEKLTQLQHLNDSNASDTEDVNKAKLKKLLALESEFESYNEPITTTNQIAIELMSNKNRPDSKDVQQMMDEYLVMYEDIKKRIRTLKQFYRKTKSIKSQNISEEVQVQTLKFEQDFAAPVDTLPTSLQRKDAFYYESQGTKKESQNNIGRLIELSNEDPNSEETFMDEHAIEPMDQADTPESTTSNEDENRSILSRGNRFFGRVIRASLPIQAFIFIMLGFMFPRIYNEYTCSTADNMTWSLEPILRYPDGSPPM